MGALRDRMIEEMKLRNFSAAMARVYQSGAHRTVPVLFEEGRVSWGGVWSGFLFGMGVLLLLSTLGLARLLTQRLLWNNLQRLLDVDAEESFRRQAAAPKRWGSELYWAPGELAPGSGSATTSDELGFPRAERRELRR